MADSQTEPGPGKRERLVSSAREVIHQQGVEKATIADIAQAAQVPVGNVYYYYKTKDELVADYGCPLGTLCSELDKRPDGLNRACAELMRLPVDWAEEQFRSMGRRDARDLAIALIASYQGIALLTNTFREPELMAREGRRIERWIDSLT